MLGAIALPQRDRAAILSVLAALIALSWLTLADPLGLGIGAALDHEEIFEGKDAVGILARLPLFVAAWVLMTVAMMLASTLPTQQAVAAIAARRGPMGPGVSALLFTAGYVAVWSAFGVAAFGVDLGVHRLVEVVHVLDDHELLLPGGLTALAGLYQFTELKDRCLTVCRTPMSFVMTRWRGGRHGALAMGLDHGLYCLGCCWPLMLLMFAFAATSLPLMLLAAVYFFAEKALVQGDSVSRAVGVAFVAVGLGLLAIEVGAIVLDAGAVCAHGEGAC
ncbi:MAG TPA: DUF2182 domain-containing protein [Dehalococcoidia bacterium]|nr:DUF2182 domain-containing protein [Dehalococcoidia bacterium]